MRFVLPICGFCNHVSDHEQLNIPSHHSCFYANCCPEGSKEAVCAHIPFLRNWFVDEEDQRPLPIHWPSYVFASSIPGDDTTSPCEYQFMRFIHFLFMNQQLIQNLTKKKLHTLQREFLKYGTFDSIDDNAESDNALEVIEAVRKYSLFYPENFILLKPDE